MINMKIMHLNMIDQQFVDDITFCWISYPGCIGPDGVVFFMNIKGDIYWCDITHKSSKNYINPNILFNKINEYGLSICLKNIRAINEWEEIYMGGMGNYLYIKPTYALLFYRFINGYKPIEIFEHWQNIARYILCTQWSTNVSCII